MHLPLLFSIIILYLAAITTLLQAIVGQSRLPKYLVRALVGLMLSVAVWEIAEGTSAIFPDLPSKILCAKFEYFGIYGVAPCWYILCRKYADSTMRLTKNLKLLLFGIPGVTVILVFLYPLSQAVRSRVGLDTEPWGDGAVLNHGFWFWIQIVHNYIFTFLGAFTVFKKFANSSTLFAKHSIMFCIGAILPIVANFTYITHLNPLSGLDLTPFGFTITGLMFVIAHLKTGFLNIIPIARDVVLEQMRDAVIVTDVSLRIIDVNPSACKLFGSQEDQLIG